MNFFVRLVSGLSRGFLLILHSGSPANPGLSLGQTQFVPGTIPGTKGGTESLCAKKFMCLSRSLFLAPGWGSRVC